MKRFFISLGIFIVFILVMYNLWSELGRAREKQTGWVDEPKLKARFYYESYGRDSGRGNLVMVHPWLTANNYSTAFNFEMTLGLYLQQLQREKLIGPRTVVVFPAGIGDGLFLMKEKEKAYNFASAAEAISYIRWTNIFSYLRAQGDVQGDSMREFRTVMQMKSQNMAEAYGSSFQALARKYKVNIAAGSIMLPAPSLHAGSLEAGTGPLLHTMIVVDTAGRISSRVYTSPQANTWTVGWRTNGEFSVLPGKRLAGLASGFALPYESRLSTVIASASASRQQPVFQDSLVFLHQGRVLAPRGSRTASYIINLWQ